MTGNFAFTGHQRSISYGCFHADIIPNSVVTVSCPVIACEMVNFQNDPNSTGNLRIGSDRLGIVNTGILLQPGEVSGWIPVENLNLIQHKEDDATTYLRYMLIGCMSGDSSLIVGHLLLEDGGHLLLEDGGRIIL